jgi:putative transposase
MSLTTNYPVHLVCQVLGYPRSSYYRQGKARDEQALCEAIAQVAAVWPTYGYRRITAQLQREGWIVNRKRVRRIMGKLGLHGKHPQRRRRTTDSRHSQARFPNLLQGMEVIRPDQVWVSDITYIRLHTGFVYLAVSMDVFTRGIRGWHLGLNLDRELTLVALRQALRHYRPEIHHSDQGLQYACAAYVQLLEQAQIQISMAEVGKAWQNGFAERVMRTIKEEEVDLSEYHNYHDAYRQIGQFLEDVYMRKRVHSSLGYLTPVEFASQWLAQQPTTERLH